MIRGALEAIGITLGFIAGGMLYYQVLSAQVASEAGTGLTPEMAVSESGAGVVGSSISSSSPHRPTLFARKDTK